jgi:hypothetical protein
MDRRTRLVYGVLATVWALMLVWQVLEHNRVKRAARAALIHRAKDISTTVGLVLASGTSPQRPVITTERLELALNALVKPEDLVAVAMLNTEGDVVASAGESIEPVLAHLRGETEHWGEDTVALMNPVALGTNVASETDTRLVVPRKVLFGTNRPPFRPPGPPPGAERMTNATPVAPGTNGTITAGGSEGSTNALAADRPPGGPNEDPAHRVQIRKPRWKTGTRSSSRKALIAW